MLAVAEPRGPDRASTPASPEVAARLLKCASAPKSGDVNARTRVVTRESDRTLLFETQDRANGQAWVHRRVGRL